MRGTLDFDSDDVDSDDLRESGSVRVLHTCALAALALLVLLVAYCRRGIDLTDESFYLTWMRQPGRYRSSVLLFGFVYHPLYVLCAGSVALLRRINAVTTFLLAMPPAYLALPRDAAGGSRPTRLALAVALSSGVLVFFHTWLPAPSYNGLALHALLVAATALLLAHHEASRVRAWAPLLLALAGWMAFMAKPTTAAALAVVVAAWALVGRRMQTRGLAIAAALAFAALMASALAIDGSVDAFVGRLRRGAELLRLLGAGQTIENVLRLDAVDLQVVPVLALLAGVTLVAVATVLVERPATRSIGLLIAGVCATGAFLLTLSGWRPEVDAHSLYGLQLAAAPLGLVAARVWRNRGRLALARSDAALAITLALFPFAHAIGGGASYWVGAAKVPFFWLLAALVLVRGGTFTWRALLPAAGHTLAITAVLILIALAHPTRQPQALALDTEPDDFGSRGRPVLVSLPTAAYLAGLRDAARSAGFQPGTPMIDLTGHAPGALYALEADALGQPWLIGGYDGSADFARAALDEEPCEKLAAAWVLIEERGPRRLPSELLLRYGIDLKRDTVSAGAVWTPVGESQRSYGQRLLKPLRTPDAALDACRGAR